MFIYHFNRLIRNRILWGFFAIIIAFAFIAVDYTFKDPQGSQVAGSINGKKVPADEFDQVVRVIRGIGRNRDNETPVNIVDRRAWEQIAARVTAEKNGMGTSKAEVQASLTEMFQGGGGFDMNRYRALLADQGLTPQMYEEILVHQIAVSKNALLVESAAWISPMELDDELTAMTDRFTVQAATVSNRFADVEMRLSDDDLRKFYEENKASFALPDRVSVRYISIPVTNYLSFVTVPEEDLQEYYDSHIDTYTRATTNDTTETIPYAEVREKILEELKLEEARYCASTAVTFNIYGKLAATDVKALQAMADQEGLAIKTSPLFSAEEPLYWADNAQDFASAAFELDPERSDSRFGIVQSPSFVYVIERADFSAAHTPTYETVLNDLKPRAQAKARSDAFQDYVKELRGDLRKLLDEGKNFTEAAQAKALNVTTSLTYSVHSIQGQNFPNSFSIAYGAMTLRKGDISEALPASASHSLLVYVQDRQPGDALAAEMMRAQIRAGIARRRNANLFGDWLAWNLDRQDFKPSRSLTADDEDPAFDAADE